MLGLGKAIGSSGGVLIIESDIREYLINKGKKLIIIGFTSIAILFLLYGRYQDPEVFTPSALESIQRIALSMYQTINWS